MILLKLFIEFFKVSCFTFGGAYGAIALIRDMVMQNGWLSEERLAYMIAISESTPGPIMVNMATYVGSSQAGLWGAAVATLAVVLPSFVVILLVMIALRRLMEHPAFQAVLGGVKPCVIGIILATGIQLILGNISLDLRAVLLTVLLAGGLVVSRKVTKKGIQPIGLIALSALLGMVVYGI